MTILAAGALAILDTFTRWSRLALALPRVMPSIWRASLPR